jgi:hypothetical protein
MFQLQEVFDSKLFLVLFSGTAVYCSYHCAVWQCVLSAELLHYFLNCDKAGIIFSDGQLSENDSPTCRTEWSHMALLPAVAG